MGCKTRNPTSLRLITYVNVQLTLQPGIMNTAI